MIFCLFVFHRLFVGLLKIVKLHEKADWERKYVFCCLIVFFLANLNQLFGQFTSENFWILVENITWKKAVTSISRWHMKNAEDQAILTANII